MSVKEKFDSCSVAAAVSDLYCRTGGLSAEEEAENGLRIRQECSGATRRREVALMWAKTVLSYSGAVAIAQVAMFYGMRVKPITERQQAKKAQYGGRRAPRRQPFEGRVEGGSPHPPLKGQGKGSEAYLVQSSRWCSRNTIVILPL